MSWDAMIAYELRATDPVEAHHEWWKKSGGHGTGRWSQKAFLAGTRWVIEQQTRWDSLTEKEAIYELRKGQDSLFWPLFMNEARIWADCPTDGRVTVGVEGFCDACGHDWMR